MSRCVPFLVAAVLTSGSFPAQDAALEAARTHRAARGPAILGELRELAALPCVAGDVEGLAANVDWLVRAFARRGVALETLREEGASPLLVGELRTPGAGRTLGVYVHYDGQPVDPTRWTFGPWTPTLTTGDLRAGGKRRPFPSAGEALDPEWRLYGRATGDDRAPLVAWLAALDALRAARIPPTVNVVFLFDGEEEAGSPHLGAYLERLGERLDTVDVWLFCDGPVHQSRRPQLCFGVRGITGLELTVYGAARPLHSGHYGNYAPNAGERLAALLAGMKDERGWVTIEGFYDSTIPPSAADRAALDALPDFEAGLRADLGLPPAGEGAEGYFESLLRPSLNVRGLASGNVGALARNVVPSEATASIDLRLVRGNDPASMLDLVEAHVARAGYVIVREDPTPEVLRSHEKVAKIVRGGGYPAAATPLDHPLAREVAAAARRVSGRELLLVPTLGGSLPLYLFTAGLGKPIVIVPIANHDDNQHAPDENLRVGNLLYGIDLFAALLTAGSP